MTDEVRHPALASLATIAELVDVTGTGGDETATIAALNDADVVVVRNLTTISAAVLGACPSLRVVARVGVGLDNIDVAAADRAGAVVLSPRGANAVSVAEHAVGLALALARRVVVLDRTSRAGGWDRTLGRELHGGTWGILGAGATGSAVARLAAALGMHVLAHDPYVAEEDLRARGVEPVSADELARRSDVLSLHVPGGPATRHVVDAALLGLIRPDALLINLARGDVLDEDALLVALEAGRLGGAALDVRAQEPPRPGALELRDDVVLTPHVGGLTVASMDRIFGALVSDIHRLLADEPAEHAVGSCSRLVADGVRRG